MLWDKLHIGENNVKGRADNREAVKSGHVASQEQIHSCPFQIWENHWGKDNPEQWRDNKVHAMRRLNQKDG